MKTCIYCNKPTSAENNQSQPVCETEWICDEIDPPSFEELQGDDPHGRDWLP